MNAHQHKTVNNYLFFCQKWLASQLLQYHNFNTVFNDVRATANFSIVSLLSMNDCRAANRNFI